jgi:hypothetical protein
LGYKLSKAVKLKNEKIELANPDLGTKLIFHVVLEISDWIDLSERVSLLI